MFYSFNQCSDKKINNQRKRPPWCKVTTICIEYNWVVLGAPMPKDIGERLSTIVVLSPSFNAFLDIRCFLSLRVL